MNWEEQVSYLVSSWFEKGARLKELKISVPNKNRPSSLEKVTKSGWEYTIENESTEEFEVLSPLEKVTKLRPSLIEKVTNLPNKKLQYLVAILLLSGIPILIDDLIAIFAFRHRSFFRQNYLNLLESIGFIKKTNPDKPTASNQKYLITEKGKHFLTGKDFK